MLDLFRKHSVTVLDRNWNPIFPVIKIKHIPRSGELIYMVDEIYYRVINVIHNIGKKQGIFLVTEPIDLHQKNIKTK